MVKETWAALASFSTCLFRRCLLDLSHSAAQLSCLIRLRSDVKTSTVTGVTGVKEVSRNSLCQDVAAIVAVELFCSADCFAMSRITLSGFAVSYAFSFRTKHASDPFQNDLRLLLSKMPQCNPGSGWEVQLLL